ncbi:MAG: hypothetical protein K8T20_16070 [Planctomycetes bacterium]|nr:hypothetical protein [Planctomycetota bacterium]
MNVEKRHRSRGVPEGCEIRSFSRERHEDRFSAFLGGYLGRLIDEMAPTVARAVRGAPQMLIMSGEVEDPPDLAYLRDALGVVAAMFEGGAIAVLDATAFHWWTAEAWKRDVHDPDKPTPASVVTIMKSEDPEDPGRLWIHTRGMRKFGRPDIGVYGAPATAEEAVADLCSRFIEMQALGAVIPRGQAIRMRDLPAGMTCNLAGSLEDPDYNNVHIDLRWPPSR